MNQLQDYIIVVPNAVPHDVCDEIINEYKNSNEWVLSTVQNGVLNTSIRNCSVIGISTNDVISKNLEVRKTIDDKIFSAASYALSQYRKIFPTSSSSQDTGYDLLRYETGQYYGLHIDSFVQHPRELSCSFLLNDEYEGGAFSFFDKKIVHNLKKGDALLFPSNFMFPHEIEKITSGTRYSIITWFI